MEMDEDEFFSFLRNKTKKTEPTILKIASNARNFHDCSNMHIEIVIQILN